jgi:hypothetical protein
MDRRRVMALIGAGTVAGFSRPARARETPDAILDSVFAEHAPPWRRGSSTATA